MSEQRKEIRAALLKAAAPKRDRGREALALGIDSLTGGWGDEIVGAVGGEGEGRRFRADRKAFADHNPVLDLTAQLGGAVVAPGAVAGRALMKAPMVGGAALGALYGGSGGSDEVTAADRAKGAATGAAVGGALGGVFRGVTARARPDLSKINDSVWEHKLWRAKLRIAKDRLDRDMIARTNGAPQNAAPKMGGTMLRDSGARGYKPTTEPKAPGTDIWDKYNGTTPPQMAARKPTVKELERAAKARRYRKEETAQQRRDKGKLPWLAAAGLGTAAAGAAGTHWALESEQ